jgi:hypothetical protein
MRQCLEQPHHGGNGWRGCATRQCLEQSPLPNPSLRIPPHPEERPLGRVSKDGYRESDRLRAVEELKRVNR